MQYEMGETGIELKKGDNRKRLRLRDSLSISLLSRKMEMILFVCRVAVGI